jgi:hypothetical protein
MLCLRYLPRRENIVIEQLYRKLLWAGTYPLLLALMVGAAWVDRIYAHSLKLAVPDSALAAPMQRVSDLLLLGSAAVFLAGLLAAWLLNGVARALVVASLAVFCLELLMPVMAAALPGGGIYLAMLGPALRIGILLAALGLALLATRRVLA